MPIYLYCYRSFAMLQFGLYSNKKMQGFCFSKMKKLVPFWTISTTGMFIKRNRSSSKKSRMSRLTAIILPTKRDITYTFTWKSCTDLSLHNPLLSSQADRPHVNVSSGAESWAGSGLTRQHHCWGFPMSVIYPLHGSTGWHIYITWQ